MIKETDRILHLSLKKQPFEVMVKGEKKEEYRKDTKWIRSRLFDKQGFWRDYDYVKFVNGYGSDKPYFIVSFLGAKQNKNISKESIHFSNGLRVDIENSDFIISTGNIIEIGNIIQI